MTRQQIDGYAAVCISALSRCTRKGLEYLQQTHGHTILLLQWHRKGICQIAKNGMPSLTLLMQQIQQIQMDESMYRPASAQPTLEWEMVQP